MVGWSFGLSVKQLLEVAGLCKWFTMLKVYYTEWSWVCLQLWHLIQWFHTEQLLCVYLCLT